MSSSRRSFGPLKAPRAIRSSYSASEKRAIVLMRCIPPQPSATFLRPAHALGSMICIIAERVEENSRFGRTMSEHFHVRVTKDYLVFSAAHFITFAGNVCERLHGHNYRVAAEVEGQLVVWELRP